MSEAIQVGDRVRVEVRFTDEDGNPADPTAATFEVRSPGPVISIVPATDDPSEVGLWYGIVEPTVSGYYEYDFLGTGNVMAATPNGHFQVDESVFGAEQVPWVDSADASELTGESLTAAQLREAAMDVWEELGWIPEYGVDLTGDEMREVMQRQALRRAIAWQAAHRKLNPPSATLAGVRREKILSYEVEYTSSAGTTASGVGASAKQILSTSGLYRRLGGHSRPGRSSRQTEYIDVEL